MVFTTALRVPLMLMMGCGYVTVRSKWSDLRGEVYDYGRKKMVTYPLNFPEEYDPTKHGEIVDWLEEGEVVPGLGERPDGKRPIHRHKVRDGIFGAHQYHYE